MTSTQTQPTAVNLLKEFMAEAQKFVAENAQTPPDQKYVVTSEFVEVSKDTVTPLIKELRKAKQKVDKAKAELEAAEAKIKDLMDGAEILVIAETQQHVVESRVTVAQVFDTTKFKKENPELAAQFQRPRYSRSFRLLV